MLWSLLKALLFFAIIVAATWGAAMLSETDGGIRVAMMGVEVTLGPLQSAIAALVLVGSLWLLFKLVGLVLAVLRFVSGDETALSRYFDRNREKRGYRALSEALFALAAGDGKVALSRAAKAEKLLNKPEITTLITAQAATLAGERDKAKEAWKALVAEDASRFVGVRGLLKLKLDEGDTETALKLAEKAFALKPKHPETQDVLLKLQADKSDWSGARQTLAAKLKSGVLPRDVWKRRDAVLALQEAQDRIAAGETERGQELAIEAAKASPELVPAVAMGARALARQGNERAAAKLLRKAWDSAPHPELAAAFADLASEETPAERLKRFRKLTDARPDDAETRLLLAELHIAAEDFPAARRALGDLATEKPTARTLAIMAAIERGSGAEDSVVRGWLARALTAPRGPQWVCGKCQTIHAAWQPVCSGCRGFDTLSWTEPPEQAAPSPTQAEMLPVIVGAPPAPEPVAPEAGETAPEPSEEAPARP